MRADRFLPFFLLALLLAVPASSAQDIEITDIDALTEDEEPLRLLPQDELVIFRVTVNNTGNSTANGTFAFVFTLEAEDGSNQTATVRKNLVLPPGNSTTVDYRWNAAGRKVGNYTVTLEIEEVAGSAVRTSFEVAENAVPAGSLVDRMVDFAWFFGAFLVVFVLFIVVLAARKR